MNSIPYQHSLGGHYVSVLADTDRAFIRGSYIGTGTQSPAGNYVSRTGFAKLFGRYTDAGLAKTSRRRATRIAQTIVGRTPAVVS